MLFAFGLVTPFAALAITVVMLSAIGTVHWKNGFFNSAGGFEYNLLIMATAMAVTATGPASHSTMPSAGREASPARGGR